MHNENTNKGTDEEGKHSSFEILENFEMTCISNSDRNKHNITAKDKVNAKECVARDKQYA